jgi:hypothetical protein
MKTLRVINATLATIGIASACLFAAPAPAKAVILPSAAFSTVALPGVSLAQQPALRGVTIASTKQAFRTQFNIAGKLVVWSGILRSDVVREGNNKLAFYYQVYSEPTNTSNLYGLLAFTSAQAAPHVAQALDVNWRSDMGGTISPNQAMNTTSYILFQFQNGGLAPGQTSRSFFIRTNAVNYALNDQAMVYNTSTTIPVYGPAP